MLTLRVDTWRYKLGMAVSVLVVAIGIPLGTVACVLWFVDLL